ncbi:glycoside hydrolase domain-containing protein [Brevibacillus antibioticus]|uniref:glycoside hydrolase domain-containing protein n=1 Tax=Brevibacillus antibioticus TaxID=2570228 RepID=UPI001390610D
MNQCKNGSLKVEQAKNGDKESQRITDADLYIIVVYQNGGRDSNEFTYKNGKKACRSASSQGVDVGQPFNTIIYFCGRYGYWRFSRI